MRLSWIPPGLLLFAALGCGSMSGDDGGADPKPASDGEVTPDSAIADAAPPPTSIAELQPSFVTLGNPEAAPQRLLVRFGRDVRAEDAAETLDQPEGLQLQPPVDGTWRWGGPDHLVFEPTVGFAPATSYTVSVTSVPTRWGAIGGEARLHTFEVPSLALLRATRAVIAREHFDIDLLFSGPIQADAAPNVTFTAEGRSVVATRVPSANTDRARYRIHRDQLRGAEVDVRVDVAEGFRSAVTPAVRADGFRATLQLDARLRGVEIEAVSVREAADGPYVQVICHDAAVGDRQYWWDRNTYDSYNVSERCLLARDALANVRFDPPVDNVYVAEATRGFRLFGDFREGELDVHIDAGAYTEDGGVLKKDYRHTLKVPKRTPRVELVAKQGRYLPRSAWGNLPVRHLNADAVQLEIRRVPPQNLVFWLSADTEQAGARTSDLIHTQTIPVSNPSDRLTATWFDVAAALGDQRDGLFQVQVKPVLDVDGRQKHTGEGDTSRLVLTDMHLIAKATEPAAGAPWSEQIHAFVVDATSGRPRPGVTVDAVRASGFVMATCRTGSDGACALVMPPADSVDTAPPIALVARAGDDLTYLKFDELRTPIADDDVAGRPWAVEAAYTASVYSDRGVYRPGDTVQLAAIVRNSDHDGPEGLPVELRVFDPRNNLVRAEALTTDRNGMVSYSHRLGSYAETGSWDAHLLVGGDEVTSYRFAVEEFVPERMKVETAFTGVAGLSTERRQVQVDARYLFGGSAAGSRVDVGCTIRPGRFAPARNGNFHYGPVFVGTEQRPWGASVPGGDGVLDAEGRATLPCGGGSEPFGMTGDLVAEVDVFEGGGGRTTRATATTPVHPEAFYIGLDAGADTLGRGDELNVSGVVVDWDGAGGAHTDSVEVVFYRLDEEYGWWWWDGRGEEAYDLHLRRVEESRTRVRPGADGRFSVKLSPRADAAGFLVRATAGNARTDLRIEGTRRRYSWSDGGQVDRTPKPGRPTALPIQLPPTIRAGEPVTVKVDMPYAGRALFTVETDRLLTHAWVDAQAGETTWTFTLPEFVPNVYVAALLVKDPKTDSPEGHTPERGFGVASVTVDPRDHRLELKLEVPDEVRSNSPLPIKVDLGKAGAQASVTIAAVDEGILQLTRFDSPDPLGDIFARRRLGVTTYETVGWSMLMPAGPSSAHGGGGADEAGRVQAVKPVALWSGVVQADANGRAEVVLDVPQYRGQLRVMAVAATTERIGSADTDVTVRDPLVLQTTLPRFLTQGDRFEVPVFVTNMSGKARDVVVTMQVEDLPWPGTPTDGPAAPAPVRFDAKPEQRLTLADGATGTVVFSATAVAQVGAARFRVEVASDPLVSHEQLDVPFSPSGPKQRTIQQLELSAGTLDLGPHLEGWLPTTERTAFWVTPNPYSQAMGHLEHLVRYPYGCVEQTTSSTRPLLFVRDLVPALVPDAEAADIDDMIQRGIDRVLSMQTPSGGFAYWPGRHDPTAWGTVYATHMLLDARALGHAVPKDRIDEAIAWLELALRDGVDDGWGRTRVDPYAHYVLALAGKPQKARAQAALDALSAGSAGHEAEAAYLLKAALYKAGDRRHEADLRAPDASPLTFQRRNDWSFYSDLRRRGMVLSVYHDLFGPGTGGAEDLARLVARGLATNRSRYYTTQELVWGITGLGKRINAGSRDYSGVELRAGNKPLTQVARPQGAKNPEPMWDVPRASERDLSLRVDDPGAGTLYLLMTSEGVREGATLQTGGEGLQLTRTYLDADGSVRPSRALALGDMVYTRIEVTNKTSERVQNLALVDRFPAGWEIENPRLGRGSVDLDWVANEPLWEPDHLNLRDDRLELFGALEPGESRVVVYALRAVTAGTFSAPPVELEAMYDPTLWARQAGGPVTIQGPWSDASP